MSEPIIFGNAQEGGDHELGGASPIAINVLVDGKGVVRRRPGIAAYAKVPADSIDPEGVDGLFVTADDTLIAVGGSRHIYRLPDALSQPAMLDYFPEDLSEDVTTPTELLGARRPTFAENEVALVLAAGNEIQKIDLETFVSSRLDTTSTDSPPSQASHVIAHASRLLSNDLDPPTAGQVRYSKTGQVDYDEWPARYFVTAESKPDPVVAIYENINEVWAFGTQTTQIFVPDASSVYAPSKTLRRGAAPYSVIEVDEAFAWFDSRFRRFVLSDGRSVTDLSPGLGKTLDAIGTIDDCFGYRVAQDQFDCLVWTFPTDGRTFCYQLNGGWSQWHGRSGSNWTLFPVSAHVARSADGVDVVGLTTGRVCQLTTGANDDLGSPIVADVMTGFISRGTDARKWCKAVRLALRRGHTSSITDEPVAFLSWRDDTGAWGDPIPVGLGLAGEREIVVELTSLGIYRRRQWRLTFSGSDEWVLASASEDFEVLLS